MLKQKHRLTNVILVSIGFVLVTSPLSGETFDSLTVTEITKVNHLDVTGKTDINGHLDVKNNASIKNHLDVGGNQEIKNQMNVSGDQNVKGKITVNNQGTFQNKLIVQNNGILKKKLIVDNDGIFNEDLLIKNNKHLSEDLLVDGKGDFNKNFEVNGLLHATWKADIEGDSKIKGNEYIGKSLSVEGYKTLAGDLNVDKNVYVKNNFQMLNSLLLGGDMLVSGNESLSGSLVVGEGTNITQDLNINASQNITGNLNISGSKSLEGSLCCTQGDLSADTVQTKKASTHSLQINHNAYVNGTTFVNEIDPGSASQTTFFSGNLAFKNGKKLLVQTITPTSATCCNQNDSDCPCPADQGATILNGNVAIDPQYLLLANTINPVKKEATCLVSSDCGTTTFNANMAVDQNHTLLVNWIDPVVCTPCDKQISCQANDNGTTFLSGNTALAPGKKMLVNHINGLFADEQDNWVCFCDNVSDNDSITKATTSFSGNVGICDKYALFVNEINPVPLSGDDCKIASCAATNFSGCVSLKNGHFFGQLDTTADGKKIRLNCSEPDYFIPENNTILENYLEYQNADYNNWIASHLGFPVTQCQPVLRLNFANIDPQGSTFPQGAWVKLNILGRANINLLECNINSEQCRCPRTISTDIFSELYFFVGAGHAARCSSLIGSTTTHNPNTGFNTFSGFGCKTPYLSKNENSPTFSTVTPTKKFGHTLFETFPTIDATSAISIIGTTATTDKQPHTVDILLMGLLRLFEINKLIIHINVNGNQEELALVDFIDFECPFFIDNISIFYEIISPNLDPENPPCSPNPLFDCCIYEQACRDLTTTVTSLTSFPYDTPELHLDYQVIYDYNYDYN